MKTFVDRLAKFGLVLMIGVVVCCLILPTLLNRSLQWPTGIVVDRGHHAAPNGHSYDTGAGGPYFNGNPFVVIRLDCGETEERLVSEELYRKCPIGAKFPPPADNPGKTEVWVLPNFSQPSFKSAVPPLLHDDDDDPPPTPPPLWYSPGQLKSWEQFNI